MTELNKICGEESQEMLGETALKTLSEKRTEEERLNLIDEMLAKLTCENQEVSSLFFVFNYYFKRYYVCFL